MAVAVPDVRTRIGVATLSAALMALIGVALVAGLSVTLPRAVGTTLAVFGVLPEPPPPPLPPPPVARVRSAKPEGAAAPPNLTSRATPVAAPTPVIRLPVPPVVVTSVTPFAGPDPSQGNADVAGPGTGAGGIGTGTGSGGRGNGGGSGGDATPPRRIAGRITASDMPKAALLALPASSGRRDYTASLSFYVLPDGRPDDCRVDQSSGIAALDDGFCRLILARFRYQPAREADGTAVRSIVVTDQTLHLTSQMLRTLQKDARR